MLDNIFDGTTAEKVILVINTIVVVIVLLLGIPFYVKLLNRSQSRLHLIAFAGFLSLIPMVLWSRILKKIFLPDDGKRNLYYLMISTILFAVYLTAFLAVLIDRAVYHASPNISSKLHKGSRMLIVTIAVSILVPAIVMGIHFVNVVLNDAKYKDTDSPTGYGYHFYCHVVGLLIIIAMFSVIISLFVDKRKTTFDGNEKRISIAFVLVAVATICYIVHYAIVEYDVDLDLPIFEIWDVIANFYFWVPLVVSSYMRDLLCRDVFRRRGRGESVIEETIQSIRSNI